MSSGIDFKKSILALAKKEENEAIDISFLDTEETVKKYLEDIVKLCTNQEFIDKIKEYIINPPKTIQKFFINKLGVIFKYPDPNATELETNGHPKHLS